jgi:hypothetical protein
MCSTLLSESVEADGGVVGDAFPSGWQGGFEGLGDRVVGWVDVVITGISLGESGFSTQGVGALGSVSTSKSLSIMSSSGSSNREKGLEQETMVGAAGGQTCGWKYLRMDEMFSDFWVFFFLGRTASPISSLEYFFPANMGDGGLGEGMDSVEGKPPERVWGGSGEVSPFVGERAEAEQAELVPEHDEREDFMRWAYLMCGELKCWVNKSDVAEGKVRICVEASWESTSRVATDVPRVPAEEGWDCRCLGWCFPRRRDLDLPFA